MVSMSASASLTRRLTRGSSSAAMMRMPAAEGCCASGMNISLISCLVVAVALAQALELGLVRKEAPKSR